MKDPLTLVHETLVAYIRASPGVKKVLGPAVKNVFGYTETRDAQEKDTRSETDFPQVRFVLTNLTSNPNYSSNSVSIDANLQLLVDTGDQRITWRLLPVVFALFAAIAAAISSGTLLALKWNGYEFVKNFGFASTQTGPSNPIENKGITGWSAICELTIHMILPTAYVKEFHNGNL